MNYKDLKKINYNSVAIEYCNRSFYNFVRFFWHVVDPEDFIDAWYIKVICAHLEAVYKGQLSRLVINIPPSFGKSLICSILFPAWCWTQDSSYSFLCSTRSHKNLSRDSNKFFNLVNSHLFRKIYGHIISVGSDALKDIYGNEQKVSASQTSIVNSNKGYRLGLTTGAATTGSRGKIIILDDPNDRKDIFSKTERDRVSDYVFNTLTTRNFAKLGGAIIVVMQRLCEDDIAGIAISKGWPLLKLPIQKGSNSVIALENFKDERELGEFLNPHLFDLDTKNSILKDLSQNEYAGQYDQEPRSFEGNIVKAKWITYWNYDTLPKDFDVIMQSWDLPFDGKDTSDFVAAIVIGIKGSNFYIIDIVRERLKFTDTLDTFKALSKKWPDVLWKVVEKKANAFALQSVLEDEIEGIDLIEPVGGKAQRLYAIEPNFRAGNIKLPDKNKIEILDSNDHNLVEILENELLSFPNGKNDDLVDVITQAVILLKSSGQAEAMVTG